MLAEKARTRTRYHGLSGFAAPGVAVPPRRATFHFVAPQPDVLRRREAASHGSRPSLEVAVAGNTYVGRLQQDLRLTNHERTLIWALLASAAVFCMLGVVYLGAYMTVAYQGRQIHNLQTSLTSEIARKHALINEIGWKESPGRIAQKANAMGMVMGGKADYVIVHTPAARGTASSNPTTIAESRPSLGAGALGDN